MNSRSLSAALIAGIAGLAVFAVLLASGVVLYQRLFAGSPGLLLVLAVVSGVIGAYTGWLLAMILYSMLRGGAEGEELKVE